MAETLRDTLSYINVAYTASGNAALRDTISYVNVAYKGSGNSAVRNSLSYMNVAYKPARNIFVPNTDVSNTGEWTPAPLWQALDADDDVCISSPLTPSNDTFEVGLEPMSGFFDTNNVLEVKYQFGKVDSGNAPQDDGDVIDVTIELYEKNTNIGTWTHNDIGADEWHIIQVVDAAGKAKITKPDELSIRVNADTSTVSGAGFERKCEFCFVRTQTIGTGVYVPPEGDGAPSGSEQETIFYIGQSGLVNNGNITVNYGNPGGETGIGYKTYQSGPYPDSASLTGVSSIFRTRIRRGFDDRQYYHRRNS